MQGPTTISQSRSVQESCLARIRVALRHQVMQEGQTEPVFVQDTLRVDLAKRRVFLKESEIHLTPIEYRLLAYLIKNAGKVITHKQLLKEVMGAGLCQPGALCAGLYGHAQT